ncbi:MAG: hypothetical protein WC640_02505 [Candidatus Paceibacterota bacterium]|jgi:hypothetical protein
METTPNSRNANEIALRIKKAREELLPIAEVVGQEDVPWYLRSASERPAEIKKDAEKEILDKITPELLGLFTNEEAQNLVKSFTETPASQTQFEEDKSPYDLYSLDGAILGFLHNELEGVRVIEIGDAGRKINAPFFGAIGTSNFDTVDIKTGIDALSCLIRQPDESEVVVSFGLFEEGVLYSSDRPEEKRYAKYLAEQIFRVTPRGAISLHGLEYDGDLLTAGFIKEKTIPGTASSSGGVVNVYRKPNHV